MIKTLLPLLQLADSNFPSGAFSHSFGFETYIQEEKITNKETFEKALHTYMKKQLLYSDVLACRLMFEYMEQEDKWIEIDHILYASNTAKETRVGTQRIGERFAKLVVQLYPSPALQRYVELLKEKKVYGHSAIVFAMLGHHIGSSKEDALGTYIFSTVSTLIGNAVRGIPLGQTDGQQILISCQPIIQEMITKSFSLSEEDLGAMSPGLEIAQMKHEQLHVRLFMS